MNALELAWLNRWKIGVMVLIVFYLWNSHGDVTNYAVAKVMVLIVFCLWN